MGREVCPIMATLKQWGDKWSMGESNEPVTWRNKETGDEIPPVLVRARDGRHLQPRDILMQFRPPVTGPISDRLMKLKNRPRM